MKSTIAAALAASLSLFSLGARADLTIHYCKDLTADQVRSAAKTSFVERKYTVEKEGPSSVIGAETKKKVEIAMVAPGDIVIRWVPGFADDKDKDLTKLMYEMLWALATESKPGEVTINWCKDLTTDRFHRAALGALHKRHYAIEKDTPNTLIGAQKKYKVEITMDTPGRIAIRWVPGYSHEKNNWLDNLTRDITWSLAL